MIIVNRPGIAEKLTSGSNHDVPLIGASTSIDTSAPKDQEKQCGSGTGLVQIGRESHY